MVLEPQYKKQLECGVAKETCINRVRNEKVTVWGTVIGLHETGLLDEVTNILEIRITSIE